MRPDAQKPVLRQLSLGSVMDAIISHGPISRAQIAKLTRISKQTASEVIRDLEAGGWVQVYGQTRGGIGRTAVTYTIRPEAAYVAGVDLGGTQLRMAIADLACTVVAEASEPTDPRGGTAVLDQIAALADRLAGDHAIARERIRLLVVGTPGILDPASGAIRVAPNITGLDRIDVVALLGEAFGVDVIVENDVNIGALGERWLGRARGVETFVYIALGTGLGMGIVADGRIIRGARGGAGEIANLPIGGDPRDPANRLHGTLETAIGSAGIVARYVAAGGAAGVSVRDLFTRLDGDARARDAIDETARLMALGIVAVVATVDPEIVVLGGSIGAHPAFVDRVRARLAELLPAPPRIEASALGNRSGIVGALAVGINNIHNALFAPTFASRGLSLPAIDMAGLGVSP